MSFTWTTGGEDFLYTKLLLHMDGANPNIFTDSCGKTVTPTSGAILSASEYKFGTSSGSFDGAGYLDVQDSEDWYFKTNNWTIDFWMKLSILQNETIGICNRCTGASTNGWTFEVDTMFPYNRISFKVISNSTVIAFYYFNVSYSILSDNL